MTNQIAALFEADAARRMAGVTNHVHLPATLRTLLLALIAFLFPAEAVREELEMTGLAPGIAGGIHRRSPWRIARKDWHFSPEGGSIEDLAAFFNARAMRRIRRQRAMLGWVLRGTRAHGMRASVRRAPEIPPNPVARAPPRANPA